MFQIIHGTHTSLALAAWIPCWKNDFYWRFHPSVGTEVAICESFQEFCTLKMPANKFFSQKPLKTKQIKFGRIQAG
jgi:hypothetical protein